MKNFTFDAIGNMTVSVTSTGIDKDGKPVPQVSAHDIQPSQLKAHMPMFKDEMTAAEKFKAYGIIEALEAQ